MARKFKEARQMHKLTIAEAAERLGVSSAPGRAERNHRHWII